MITERMPVVGSSDQIDTPHEEWDDGTCEWYDAAAKFAIDRLGHGASKRKCLVIGSPLHEAALLRANGWRVWHLDIRPADGVVTGDATAMEFPDESFDAVSSTCVLCHAGLGRYGDPCKANGDVLMMGEIARVLKPGGVAVLMAGPCLPDVIPESVVYGNVHRIYRAGDVAKMATDAGLKCRESAIWFGGGWMFGNDFDIISVIDQETNRVRYGYLSVVLTKENK